MNPLAVLLLALCLCVASCNVPPVASPLGKPPLPRVYPRVVPKWGEM